MKNVFSRAWHTHTHTQNEKMSDKLGGGTHSTCVLSTFSCLYFPCIVFKSNFWVLFLTFWEYKWTHVCFVRWIVAQKSFVRYSYSKAQSNCLFYGWQWQKYIFLWVFFVYFVILKGEKFIFKHIQKKTN